ncbi:hypothetical protein PR001_g7927 [Phytophthora rubi]|uniref:FLYWCH-type domain-containing protein n=1 Tax=Phytophthora rubi TaxID=129364 RepID=A0A6A3MZ67_9STRA|nr:hypothetical protein PR001_g7927 [Phytophthora rubi]
MGTKWSFFILPSSTRFTTPTLPTTVNTDYDSDDSMSNSFELDGSDLSDAPSEETVILLTPPSSPEPGESDGHQVEAPASFRSTHSADGPAPVSGTTSVYFGGYVYARYHFTDEASHYRCSVYRRTKCKAKLCVSSMGAVETGNHMPNCVPDFRRAGLLQQSSTGRIICC